MSLLFEDLFKRLNSDLKRMADSVLSKANRATLFDVAKCIRCVGGSGGSSGGGSIDGSGGV